MKVILLKDIAKIGKKYDVKELPNGHAAHLIRIGAVELATPGKLSQLESKKKENKERREQEVGELAGAINKVKKAGVTIVAKANEKGHLFEGITAVKLQEAIAESIVELPISAIVLPEPIKEIGEFEVELINGEESTKVKLVVSAEE